jgi:hypothetical protein
MSYLCKTKQNKTTHTMTTTKDVTGKEITEGVKVMFIGNKNGQTGLLFGNVKKITDKMVFVESSEGGRQISKENCQRMVSLID